ncbi:citrate lyase acyl carrier protein [Fructilactobacillus sanfranciscensis]|uniref:Citrate lyase acyl carrier protein n=2 Tax=Fructilactobacillus sanfranciscensis TaxID=1625 RepID=G2KVZ3_FRUST|nr:citrate lyase acyl carrier protein [Fructilactobacillus sanfranciscensis]AEN99664.1 Citrate lyase acyl carrier protein [Fructilactobacillus sanfranciscensis TMW 1.1304]KRM80432.1 citrate lyase acyl carrier protein [Fructilactobacillus sanfranciscensis DSM 20451]MCG7194862.1 citrate lyase acyl carrier protein [Fructilactobacillus sanfranciscensis]MCG7196117.1 citrate lyase acyl carrier protein [Fructilactobacillus sanfranciscensis]MVF15806.1 citrate lyase acyl carrier protein [Fructilactobac
MEIKKTAIAGTLESSDIQVTVSKGNDGIKIDLTSDVKERFGKNIVKTIEEIVNKFGIENINIKAVDQGALDCVIKARTITAIQRSLGTSEEPDWEVL